MCWFLWQMFTRKFERLAASYSDAVFCDILGDENNDTRVRLSRVHTSTDCNIVRAWLLLTPR